MCAMATKVEYTPEDLLAMPNEKNYELVDGELLERNMGARSSWVGGRLVRALGDFAEGLGLGLVFPADNGFQCFPDAPNKVRRPDVSFLRTGRLPGNTPPDGWITVVPDLVVEVLSRRDLALEIDTKIDDFLRVGVPLIWVINPRTRTVRIYRSDGSSTRLTENDELTGEDVIPGFRCRIVELFPPRAKAPEAPA